MAATGARAAVVGEGTDAGIGAERKEVTVDEVLDPPAAKAKGRSSLLVWVTHLSVILLVVLWVTPVFGVFLTSFRDATQIATTGWWTALSSSEQVIGARAKPPAEAVAENGQFVIRGNIFAEENQPEGNVLAFGTSSLRAPDTAPGETIETRRDGILSVSESGDYQITFAQEPEGRRGQRIYVSTEVPPSFSTANYERVLTASGVGRSFVNSFTVAIPATIIPILIAAFAAYALAWMQFPGRGLLIAIVVGLLVVPLQMSLIPLLTLQNDVKNWLGLDDIGYVGVWLAHTGFGLPLAIYLLRNYMVGLPKEIMESARVDGASDFEIFVKIILPLSFPALASFAIFQFLWTWNDLLVAIVFLGQTDEQMVLTARLNQLLGSRGGDWEILTASAFISIIVPIVVFFALQRYLVRGLLAGSVKGG